MKPESIDLPLYKIWLTEKKSCKQKTVKLYGDVIQQFIIKDLDIDKLESYNNFIIEKGIKKRYYQAYYALRSYIEFKIPDMRLQRQLIEGMIKPKLQEPITSRRHLTDSERSNVITNLKVEKHQLIALIQMQTGVRAGDIMKIKKPNIFLEKYEDKDVLRFDMLGKRGKKITTYIFDPLMQQVILNFIETTKDDDNPFYFLDSLRKSRIYRLEDMQEELWLYTVNYQRYWLDLKQSLNKCGVHKSDFATHDFRRNFGRDIWEKYKDVEVLKRALNHQDITTTVRYLRTSGLQSIDILKKYQEKPDEKT